MFLCSSVYVRALNLCLTVYFVDIDYTGWVGRSGKCSSFKIKPGKQELGVLRAGLVRQVWSSGLILSVENYIGEK